MDRNVAYVLIDAKTGFVTGAFSVPARLFDPVVPEGRRMVVPADGVLPKGRMKLDLRKVRREVTTVASLAEAQSSWRVPELPAVARLELQRSRALHRIDSDFVHRIAAARGPLAGLHDAKRRQAEAGAGPLVADDADRDAILANAAREDERVASIETERRRVKAAVKAATTEAEIKAALATAEAKEMVI